jgi:putative glycosyltransferase (TIGR04372 family)
MTYLYEFGSLKLVVLVLVTSAVRTSRAKFSEYLSERSVVRHHQYPTRANTLRSIGYMVAAIPLALLIFPLVVLRAVSKGPWQVHVLATEGEFGPFVYLLEYLRRTPRLLQPDDLIFVLSRRRHPFCDLYQEELGCKVVAGVGCHRVLQQAVLLMPQQILNCRRLTSRDVELPPSLTLFRAEEVRRRSSTLLASIKQPHDEYVALAVHTTEYDRANNPQYLAKELILETKGTELRDAIDFLRSADTGVVLLGSLDSGNSHIPREFPRLEEFSQLGSLDEVMLAAECKYFWSDCVGAWFLAEPFGKPILMTNEARIRVRKTSFSRQHLLLPVRYQDDQGKDLTLRQLMRFGSLGYKSVGRGEIQLVRNTPEDLVAANHEMLLRVNDMWKETDEMARLRLKLDEIMSEFPGNCRLNIASTFLCRYPHLLD